MKRQLKWPALPTPATGDRQVDQVLQNIMERIEAMTSALTDVIVSNDSVVSRVATQQSDVTTLDEVADGRVFARVKGTALTGGAVDIARPGVINRVLDNIQDGAVYGRPRLTALTDGEVDMARPGVVNRHLDNIADSPTYGRTRVTALTSGEVDLSKAGVLNRNADNIAEATTRKWAAESGAQVFTGKSWTGLIDRTLGNIADDATYGRTKLTALTLGEVDLSKAGVLNRTADNLAESATRKWAAESGAQVFTGKSWTGLVDRTLGNIADDATYGRTKLTALTAGEVDLSKAGVLNKSADNIAEGATRKWAAESGAQVFTGKSITGLIDRQLDNIADSATYGRTKLTALTLGEVDLSKAGVLNRSADNIAEAATRKWAAESGAQVVTGKSLTVLVDRNLGNIADDATYGRTKLTALTSGEVDLSKAGVLNKNLDQIAETATRKHAAESGAQVFTGKSLTGLVDRTLANIQDSADRFAGVQPAVTGDGFQILSNPDFAGGVTTGYSVYDNGASGSVTLTAEADSAAPNSSGYRMKVAHTAAGSPSPGWGGFYRAIGPDAGPFAVDTYHRGSTILWRVRANIPVGYSINWASNSYGTGGSATWLTSQAGTGTWQDYVLKQVIGTSGIFSSTGFFYIDGGTRPFDWYVAACSAVCVSFPQGFAISAIDANRRPITDFASAHINKNVDNVGDGATYQRTKATALTAGEVDMTKAGVLNRTADNIAEAATRKWAAESGADVTSGKSLTVLTDRNLGNIADDATYGRTKLTALTSGEVDLSKAGVLNRSADYISEATTRKWAAESGANITETRTSADTTNVNGKAASAVKNETDAFIKDAKRVSFSLDSGVDSMPLWVRMVSLSGVNGRGSYEIEISTGSGGSATPATERYWVSVDWSGNAVISKVGAGDSSSLLEVRVVGDYAGGASAVNSHFDAKFTISGSTTVTAVVRPVVVSGTLTAPLTKNPTAPSGNDRTTTMVYDDAHRYSGSTVRYGQTARLPALATALTNGAVDLSLAGVVQKSADNISESGSRKWAAESGAQVVSGKSWTLLTDRNLGNIADDATYGRTKLTALTAGEVDLSKAGVLNRSADYIAEATTRKWAAESGADVTSGKSLTVLTDRNLGNIADDATYGRVKLTALTTGEVDLSKAGVLNRSADNISEGTTRKWAAESGAQVVTGKDIGILADGATYGRTKLTALTSGEVDMTKSGVLNRNADNIAEATTRKWAAESGADVTSGKSVNVLADVKTVAQFFTFTQTITATGVGSATIPTGSKTCVMRAWGGCGSGSLSNPDTNKGGGGGGGGSKKTVVIKTTDHNQTISHNVGTGGAGVNVVGSGNPGAATTITSAGLSFTNLNISANGGGAGTNAAGGAGGTATGGDTNTSGSAGLFGSIATGGNHAAIDSIIPGKGSNGSDGAQTQAGSPGMVSYTWAG